MLQAMFEKIINFDGKGGVYNNFYNWFWKFVESLD